MPRVDATARRVEHYRGYRARCANGAEKHAGDGAAKKCDMALNKITAEKPDLLRCFQKLQPPLIGLLYGCLAPIDPIKLTKMDLRHDDSLGQSSDVYQLNLYHVESQ